VNAAAAGFGEIDAEMESDFAAVLGRRSKPRPDADPTALPTSGASKRGSGRTRTAKTAPEAPENASVSDEPPVDGAKGPDAHEAVTEAESPRRRPGRPRSVQATGSPKLVLHTPIRIRSRMKALSASAGTLYRDQVLDALEACADRLDELVAQRNAPRIVQTGLFVREQAPQAEPEVSKQITIPGFLQSQLDVIDGLVEATGATGRSQLVNLALDEHLPGK
jgi:hypothetical protein